MLYLLYTLHGNKYKYYSIPTFSLPLFPKRKKYLSNRVEYKFDEHHHLFCYKNAETSCFFLINSQKQTLSTFSRWKNKIWNCGYLSSFVRKGGQNCNAMEWCGCFKNNNKPKTQYAAEVYFGGCNDGGCVFIIITRCNSASLVVYIY